MARMERIFVAIMRKQVLLFDMRKHQAGGISFGFIARYSSAAVAAQVIGLAGCAAPVEAPPTPPTGGQAMTVGEGLAQRQCGQCHAVAALGPSPLADAPPFRVLRARLSRADLEALLRNRMVEVHPRMPAFRADDDELNGLLDYWQGLQGAPR